MIPATGNIYQERFYDQGKQYANSYADCAECGNEIGIHGLGRGNTVTNYLKKLGWKKIAYFEDGRSEKKWVCGICLTSRAPDAGNGADK